MTWLGFYASQTPWSSVCPFAPSSPLHSILGGNITAPFLTSGDLELPLKKHLCDSAEFCLHQQRLLHLHQLLPNGPGCWLGYRALSAGRIAGQVKKHSRPSQLFHTWLSSIARSRACWRLMVPPSPLLEKASDDLLYWSLCCEPGMVLEGGALNQRYLFF